MSPYEQNFEDTVVLLDNDFDNLPTRKETSRADAWFGLFNNLIDATDNIVSSWFNSKKQPANNYYYTQGKTDPGKTFLFIGGAALVLILFLKNNN